MKRKICKKIPLVLSVVFTAVAILGLAGCPQVPEHEHTFCEEWTSDENYHWHASKCNHKDEVADKVTHKWDEGVVIVEATYFTKGVTKYTCDVCKKEVDKEDVLELYSYPVNAVTGKPATASSSSIYFGVFPQTVLLLDSDVTVYEHESLTIGSNTYYKGSDGEWYAKVLENACTFEGESLNLCYSDGSNVLEEKLGNYRYFKVEPIKWKVLTADLNTEKSLLLAENILLANIPYYEDDENNRLINGNTVYPNNYKHSQIRAYLNGLPYHGLFNTISKWENRGFLQTAFICSAQEKIDLTIVDNSGDSTTDEEGQLIKSDGSNPDDPTDYTCESTEDKLFLLSENEVTAKRYFADQTGWELYNRERFPSDYALANNAAYIENNGCWWLRSPSNWFSSGAYSVLENAPDDSDSHVNTLHIGIVPAMYLSLK